MTIHAARIGWEHAKQVTPMLRPDVAFSEVLAPHFIYGVHLIAAANSFGQLIIRHESSCKEKAQFQ
jgi:hypothetical protein